MSQSETPAAEPVREPRPGERFGAAVTRLIRLHNAMIFVVFVCGLAAVGVAYDRAQRGTAFEISDRWRTATLVMRVALPVVALLLTGVYTHLQMKRHACQMRSGPVSPAVLYNTFQRCKLLSMVLLTLAGVFASVCLVLGHRWIDLIIAAITLLLLIMTRPGLESVTSFFAEIELMRDTPGEDASP